ncbi:MAG: thermonuclease family protein [Gemmatimonadaceae bacterium]
MRTLLLATSVLFAGAAQAQRSDSAAALADSGPRTPVRAPTACVVVRIVDGDTIRCQQLGLVRLIGIDSPEANQEPFGAAASAGLRAMLSVGDTVQLEPDVETRDRYRRILAYVWHGGVMLNWMMLRQGWAVVLTYPPNVQFVDHFVAAQQVARAEQRGLWEVDGFRCLPVERRRKIC